MAQDPSGDKLILSKKKLIRSRSLKRLKEYDKK
jgi:hypothetical protein